jgi:16S rRNA (guanine966-N2)-methyltransferase
MRIIGGLYKGRRFNPGKNFRARPTTDFARENLFNILENRIDWEITNALDLFAGTGSISYELISRGCRHVTAVESDFRHCKFIEDVKKILQMSELTVLRDDAMRFIIRSGGLYQLIFADPPYDMPGFETIPEKILAADLLTPGGCLILEHNKYHTFGHISQFTELRNYGSVNFSFFRV